MMMMVMVMMLTKKVKVTALKIAVWTAFHGIWHRAVGRATELTVTTSIPKMRGGFHFHQRVIHELLLHAS